MSRTAKISHFRTRSRGDNGPDLSFKAPSTPVDLRTRTLKDELESLNNYSNGSKIHPEYHNDGMGYHIPDITFKQPENRRMRVITIGAGVSGIMAAYKIEQGCENVDNVIYEKNNDYGGTWLVNRYPMCGCDVPSPDYAFNFALNPNWSKYFSGSEEICDYIHDVAKKLDLSKFIKLEHEVIGCYFDQERGKWDVQVRRRNSYDGSFETIYDTCDFLIYAPGLFNKWKLPDIKGINKFAGRVIHTAGWPKDYTENKWKKDRVAVIGSGASSMQTVPGMQPHAQSIDVFVRTPSWFLEFKGLRSPDFVYTEEEKELLRNSPEALVNSARVVESHISKFFDQNFKYSEAQKQAREAANVHMRRMIKDERLLKGFKPTFSVGCRRLTPGDPYMRAIQEPNVNVHFTAAAEITKNGVVGADGILREADTIVCATGYDTTYIPAMPIVGLDGVDLREKWKYIPEGYLGLGVDQFPNFIMFTGPNWPINSSCIIQNLVPVSDYCVQMINKVQSENIKYLSPKTSVTRAFNQHTQAWFKGTVFNEDCNTWFRDKRSGRITTLWPGSNLHYMETIKTPRYEDYDIQYHGKNQWAYLGLGYTKANRNVSGKEDLAPTVHEEFLDKRFYS